MNAAEYLCSTPPEINIKIEAWNEQKHEEAIRDYRFIVTLLNGYREPRKFPSFDRFYPERTESGEQAVGWHVKKAMQTAKRIGDI